jgi:3',5'-cyclic AMP phosphodiesterase CpdA
MPIELPDGKIEEKLFVYSPELLQQIKHLFVVGDVHGDLPTLQKIINLIDPVKDSVIFLGDYADRGDKGMEVIQTVNNLLEKYPERVVALKGNHEDFNEEGKAYWYPFELDKEVKRKGKDWNAYFQNELKPFIEKLHLAAIIPGKYLFIHGGVSSKINSINDLYNPSSELEKDMLWSDPIDGYGEYPNRRGVGVEFGVDITGEVCKKLGVRKIIRSHEPHKVNGKPYIIHNGRVITISATTVYGTKPIVLQIVEPWKSQENLLYFPI